MKLEIMEQLSILKGRKAELDRRAFSFPKKNEAWIRGEEVDQQIEFLKGLLDYKGVLD